MKKVKCETRSHIDWYFPIHSSILHCQRIVMLYNKKNKSAAEKSNEEKALFSLEFSDCLFILFRQRNFLYNKIFYYILHHT